MSFKQVNFYIGCAIAWFVLLPLCVAGGIVALLCYAIFGEVVGETKTDVDSPTAGELASRDCLGN